MPKFESSSISVDETLPYDEFLKMRVGTPSNEPNKWGSPPRGYSNDEIEVVFKAICMYLVDLQKRPNSLGVAIMVKQVVSNTLVVNPKSIPTFLADVDCWFIARDHLRNRLGLIEWERNDGMGGVFSKPHGFRLTRSGLDAGEIKFVGVRWVWAGQTPAWAVKSQ